MANSITGLASQQRSEFPIERSDIARRSERSQDRERSGGVDFADAFANAIQNTAAEEKVADTMASQFAEGDPNIGIHDVVIASERANVSLKYTVTLKNKLVEAYREIMNTQV